MIAPGSARLARAALAGLLAAGVVLSAAACGDDTVAATPSAAATPTPLPSIAARPNDDWPTTIPVDANTTLADLQFDAHGRLLAMSETGVQVVQPDGSLTTKGVPKLRGVEGLTLTPGGTTLIAHGYGRRGGEYIRAFELPSGRSLWRAPIPASRLGYPRPHWSSEGRLLIETERGSAIFDTSNGRRLALLAPRSTYLGTQPLSALGRRAAVTVHGGLGIVNVATGDTRTFKLGFTLHAPAYSPDSWSIAGAERDLVLVSTHGGPARHMATPAPLQSVMWSPDAGLIAAYGADPDDAAGYAITVFNIATGTSKIVGHLRDGPEFEPMAWSPDSRRLAYQRSDGHPPAG